MAAAAGKPLRWLLSFRRRPVAANGGARRRPGKTLDYCKEHFSDPEFGEWYGYLRRDGLPTQPSTKGSTFKGPFHLPRMLIQVDQMLGELTAK